MTIGELSAETGLPASTIRYWEKVRVLPKPARTSGQRRYTPDAVDRINALRLAQSCGFHLDEIRELMRGFAAGSSPSLRWQKLAKRKREELAQQMERLKAMQILLDKVARCECLDLEECGRRAASL